MSPNLYVYMKCTPVQSNANEYHSGDDMSLPVNGISNSLSKYLNNIKDQITNRLNVWEIYEKYTNPYEYIYSNVPYKKQYISKYKPLSHSYFKMIELMDLFHIESPNRPIQSFHSYSISPNRETTEEFRMDNVSLSFDDKSSTDKSPTLSVVPPSRVLANANAEVCGYIEAIISKRNNNIEDKYYGMVEKLSYNNNIRKKIDYFLHEHPNIHILSGDDISRVSPPSTFSIRNSCAHSSQCSPLPIPELETRSENADISDEGVSSPDKSRTLPVVPTSGVLAISCDDKPSPDKSRTLPVVPTSGVLANSGLSLFTIENLQYCKEQHGSSMDIITFDSDYESTLLPLSHNNNHYQDPVMCRILFAQICFALTMQSINGSFILKIVDCFTESTIDMIALLSSFYKRVYITKPNTSRLSCSEKYMVCKGFLYHDASMWYPYILKSFMEMMSIPPNIYIHRFLSGRTIPYYFITKIEDYNAIFGQQQIEHIHYTISIMDIKLCSCDNFTSSNSKNMTVCNSDTLIKSEKIESIITENVKKCVYWCIKHNIPYNISFAQI